MVDSSSSVLFTDTSSDGSTFDEAVDGTVSFAAENEKTKHIRNGRCAINWNFFQLYGVRFKLLKSIITNLEW